MMFNPPAIQIPRNHPLPSSPVVLLFKNLHPRDINRFVAHGAREGGDIAHVDRELSHLNRIELGSAEALRALPAQISAVSVANHAAELAALRAKSRHKEAAAVAARGPVDPWRPSKSGPLREGILTVRAAWFGGSGQSEWNMQRVAAFREAAIAFLQRAFPDDQLVVARGDLDEEAYHLHFVIAVWIETMSKNRGLQRVLQPSANPVLRDYDQAQSLAAEHFAPLGLVRGAHRAAARRAACAAGLPPPKPRRHIPPSQYRAAERRAGQRAAQHLRERAKLTAAHQIDAARLTARATLRLVRKRAARTLALTNQMQQEVANRLVSAQIAEQALMRREHATQRREAKLAVLENGLQMLVDRQMRFERDQDVFVCSSGAEGELPIPKAMMARIRKLAPQLLEFGAMISAAVEGAVADERSRLVRDAITLSQTRAALGLDADERLESICQRPAP